MNLVELVDLPRAKGGVTLLRGKDELRAALASARREGSSIGLVPTMGYLHEGHLSLLHAARAACDVVVMSLFVNPAQFGPEEDLSRYPRDEERDLRRAGEAGADFVYAPPAEAVYPDGFATHVEVEGRLTGVLDGDPGRRGPGHFRGVTTVVAKLLIAVGPSIAVFGRKDFQQWKTIDRLVRDLDLPIEVVGMPTVREPDGLALSSRNRYLSADDRGRALAIAGGLRGAYDAYHGGERSPAALRQLVYDAVAASFDRIDYVEAVDPETLEPLLAEREQIALVIAAHLGTTRLIDNLVLGEDARP